MKKRGRVENLKPYKPGQSGNPGGQSKLQARIRKLTKEQFAEVADMIVQGNESDLKLIINDESNSMLKRYVARTIQEGYKRADWPMLNSLLERLIGKVRDNVHVTTPRKVLKKLDGSEIIYDSGASEE